MLCCSWRYATYQSWVVVPYDLDIESATDRGTLIMMSRIEPSKMNNLPLSELSAMSSNGHALLLVLFLQLAVPSSAFTEPHYGFLTALAWVGCAGGLRYRVCGKD